MHLLLLVVCTLADLGANASDSSACGGEKAGYIPNGMFCYTGLTPGSTATYSCDKDYELSGGNGELVCQDDGTWSGPTSTCEKSELTIHYLTNSESTSMQSRWGRVCPSVTPEIHPLATLSHGFLFQTAGSQTSLKEGMTLTLLCVMLGRML